MNVKRGSGGMAVRWEQVIVDAADPVALGHWWARALGYEIVDEAADEMEIGPAGAPYPRLLFVRDGTPKTVKNRLHLDLRPDDQAAELTRLLDMGARHADIGQEGGLPWVTLLDPEGNEFDVLSARDLAAGAG